MKKAIGFLLIIAGGALIYHGLSRKDSLAGDVAELQAKVANKVDGGSRVPDHMYYLAGGVALAVIGAGLVFVKSR